MSCNCNNKGNGLELFQNDDKSFVDKEVLFVEIDRLKRNSYIDANVNNDDIRVAVLYIQDLIIERVCGSCIADLLRRLICSGDIDLCRYKCHKRLLDYFIFNIFVYGVPAELSIPLEFKHRNNGVIQTDGEGYNGTNLSDIKYINQNYKDKMNLYINRAVDFIRCNRDCFKICCSCGCGCVIPSLNKDFNFGIPLGHKPVALIPLYRLRRGYHSNTDYYD